MKDGSIVLIDDNKAEVRLFEEALKRVKHKRALVKFYDGLSAFDFIQQNAKSIFLIISDLNMPLMNGMELLEKINANAELKMECVPFIFLTNSATPRDVEHAYSLSAQGYFQKPLDIDELSAIFKSILN